jgi:hypothetical protein
MAAIANTAPGSVLFSPPIEAAPVFMDQTFKAAPLSSVIANEGEPAVAYATD